jgi:hypothetical protein
LKSWCLAVALALSIPVTGWAFEPTAALNLEVPSARGHEFHRGASLGFFLKERGQAYETAHYTKLIDRATTAGVTHLQLAVRWFQEDIAANQIVRSQDETVSDEVLIHIIRVAKERKLTVFLMPFVFVKDTQEGSWRGALAPTNPDIWWSSYTDYLLHYATLAADCDVDFLAVGSELKSLTHAQDRWRPLIETLRSTYSGQLVYSANWDNYRNVAFWDAVDRIGVNGYFPLSQTFAPSLGVLKWAWWRHRDALVHWAGGLARPIILTEVGYRSSRIAAAEPWNHFDLPIPDPDTQLNCYLAFYATWMNEKALQGLYTWNWYGEGGLSDAGFTPYAKPAYEVIRRWFRDSVVPE